MEKEIIEQFERAFSSNSGGCVRECRCGRKFYDHENTYDWEPGELEELEKDPKATGLPYSVGEVEFESKCFVVDCDCWHTRAEILIGFITSHGHAIANFLTLDKQRKQRIADRSPVVE